MSTTPPGPVRGGASGEPGQTLNDPRSIRRVGFSLLALLLVLLTSLYLLSAAAGGTTGLRIGSWPINPEQVLFLAVLAAGALGGCIHTGTSFSDYVGNGEYKATWQWWYLLRPFIGGCLALAFYFLIRGGIMSLTGGTAAGEIPNFYGMTSIAALVGMFSKQATDKLDDVFDTLFKSNKDAERKDGLDSSVPVLAAVDPASVEAGSGDTTLTLSGGRFGHGAVVHIDGRERPADSVKANAIQVTLKAEELATPASHRISVLNPSPGGISPELEFRVADRRVAQGTPDDRGEPAGGVAPEPGGAGTAAGPSSPRAPAPADSATDGSPAPDGVDAHASSAGGAAGAPLAAARGEGAGAPEEPDPGA